MKRKMILFGIIVTAGFLSLQAQTIDVEGTVTSAEDGNTLPGVSVVVKGTTVGTVTDINGAYQIAVPADYKILIFSFIGMVSQEVSVNNRSNIDINLETKATELSEVVITAAGIRREKKALGYSVEEVDGDQIQQVA